MKLHMRIEGNYSGHCAICKKQISKNIYPWSVMDEELFYWKCFLHGLIRHRHCIWKGTKIMRHIAALLLSFLFTAILMPLKLACLPFWALYEYVL